jgi:hypothetical protein
MGTLSLTVTRSGVTMNGQGHTDTASRARVAGCRIASKVAKLATALGISMIDHLRLTRK